MLENVTIDCLQCAESSVAQHYFETHQNINSLRDYALFTAVLPVSGT